ncbi:YfaZ family outer membrane protein [Saccharospirillum impatiens]|uniref:YfaZ family outer membrane protein n=1 Tax=Saccharospirillum impatiens TaxID=169438 RepID=UPI0004171852|nr:YfaZ family outer membrane protein [Saccharospirillum impatiens]
MTFKTWLAVCAVLVPLGAQAGGSLDIALSNTSVRLEHEAVRVGSGAHITTGLAYSEDNQAYAFSAGFNAVDATMANRELIGGIGFKGFLFDAGEPGFALGVGGFLRWQPDFMNGLGTEAQLYYAPDILSFGDVVAFQEVIARVTYKVLPQARVFVGWHDIAGYYRDTTGGPSRIDNTFNVGFRMNY